MSFSFHLHLSGWGYYFSCMKRFFCPKSRLSRLVFMIYVVELILIFWVLGRRVRLNYTTTYHHPPPFWLVAVGGDRSITHNHQPKYTYHHPPPAKIYPPTSTTTHRQPKYIPTIKHNPKYIQVRCFVRKIWRFFIQK